MSDSVKDNTSDAAHYEDAKGLVCPLPLLRVKRALNRIGPGEIISVEATDEGSWLDFMVFCETQAHELLEQREEDGVYYYRIQKGAPQ